MKALGNEVRPKLGSRAKPKGRTPPRRRPTTKQRPTRKSIRGKEKPRVSVIGLGRMGSALAEALLNSGFRLTVWNRTLAKSAPLRAQGASVAPSVAAAARGADIVVICLIDHAATKHTFMTDTVGAAINGKTIVELTTATTDEINSLEQWVVAKAANFLNGCILVYPDDIRSGSGVVLYSGTRDVFDAGYTALVAMSGQAFLVGERTETAGAVALAYFHFVYPALIGFLHGAAICHRSNVSIELFFREVVAPSLKGAALFGMFRRLAAASAARKYDAEVQATLDTWNEGLSTMITDLQSLGFNTGLLQAVKSVLDTGATQGYGGMDLASVFETLVKDHVRS